MAARRNKRNFNGERVEKIIRFIECLKVPSGKGRGKPFRVRPWQRKFIEDVYGPRGEDGFRLVRRAVLSIARKNGKTALIAALVLVHLVGPEAEVNGEIYSAANDREQAGQVFKMAKQIVEADPELRALLRVIPSTKSIACYGNGSFYRALSAEAGTKHGLNPTVVIFDELAQAKDRELYDALDTAMGAREEPIFITISTQSRDPEHILSEMIDDGLSSGDPTTVCHLYEVPEDEDDIFNPDVWALANPALGDFRLMKDVKAMADRAARLPSFENTFRNLYLNQRVNLVAPLIPRLEWKGCQATHDDDYIQPGEPIYLGLDLSATTDLTALAAVSAEGGDRLAAWHWKPKHWLEEHARRDRFPYEKGVKEGWLEAPEGRAIDYGYVAQRIAQISAQYEVVGLAYDRWRIESLLREFSQVGFDAYIEGKDPPRAGALRLVPYGQGYKDMAPAIDALEISVMERTLKHPGNPLLTFCFANAIPAEDPAGNRKLDKSKSRFRIDGAVAATMALGLKVKDLADAPPPPSPWDTADFEIEAI